MSVVSAPGVVIEFLPCSVKRDMTIGRTRP
jgi:hypothetical protein